MARGHVQKGDKGNVIGMVGGHAVIAAKNAWCIVNRLARSPPRPSTTDALSQVRQLGCS